MTKYLSHLPTLIRNVLMVLITGFVYPDVSSQNFSDPLLDVKFEYPSTVAQGEKFAFVIVFEKQSGYNPAGMITQVWPKGFQPFSSELDFGRMQIEGQQVVITWDKMAEIGRFSILYFVETGGLAGGTYPVISDYRDKTGMTISKTIPVYVIPGEMITVPKISLPDPEPKISITADFPMEVTPNSSFTLLFTIEKGKNVLPAALRIKLPPGFRPSSDLDLKFAFDATAELLLIFWDQMPPNPSFSVPVNLIVEKPIKAVYPFSAYLIIEKETKATYNAFITVTDQPGKAKTMEVLKTESVPTDVTNRYSELESLLNKWIESTSTARQPSSQKADTLQLTDQSTTARNESAVNKSIESIEYRIQVFATTVKTSNLSEKFVELGISQLIKEDFDGNTYRYTIGSFTNQQIADEYLKALRIKGLTDAYIVKFVDGVREK